MSKIEDIKQGRAEHLLSLEGTSFIRFKGMPLVSTRGTFGFAPIASGHFSALCYESFGNGISRGSIADLQHVVEAIAPDLSDNDRYISFRDEIWDMKTLTFIDDPMSVRAVYSSKIALNRDSEQIEVVKGYLLELSDGDPELASDYLQMVAPMFMYKRPVGVIWALGAGANGKSAFLESLDLALGKHFSHLTMEMIEDGRATPALRGVLANINTETSEKRVEDMSRYKNIGAHEPFDVRILGTHEVVSIDTRFHTIFSANNIPSFGDKSMGSRRRTILVPFPAVFVDDPSYNDRTFTPAFMGALLYLIIEMTKEVAEHGYQWSQATQAVQSRYNQDANTAEAFARYLDEQGIVAFKNYHIIRMHYETWCASEGSVPLGRTQLTRAFETVMHPNHVSFREDNLVVRRYFAPGYNPENVTWLSNGYATAIPDAEKVVEQMKLDEGGKREW